MPVAARQRLLRGEAANFPLGTVALCALTGSVREPNGPPLIDVFAACLRRITKLIDDARRTTPSDTPMMASFVFFVP